MLNWINRKYGTDLNEDNLAEIKNFTLLWNIYENTCFDCNFTIDKLEAHITQKNPPFNEFEMVLTYFQNRYISNGAPSMRYPFLNLRARDREPLVLQVLANLPSTDNDKILATGIIVYRYRNNLFHGEKSFREIHEQQENFRIANTYLTVFLDH